VVFEVPNNVKLAEYHIQSAFSREHHTFFNSGNVAKYTIGQYSESLGLLENTDNTLYNDLLQQMDTAVIPPVFYTEMHQYIATSDLFTIGSDLELYSGRDLIDNKTSFEFMDINKWDTIRLSIMNMLYKVECETPDTFDITASIYESFSNFIGKDSYFIYDSDANGMDKCGVNIVEGTIPFSQYYPKAYIPRNIADSLILFENDCHYIEKEYGHIRLYCYPSNIGNKIKITFKDYVNAPFSPINTDAIHNKRTAAIDHGYHINKNIDDAIDYLTDEYKAYGLQPF
jgi:hypothetical protein